jgi:hypothetical protein
MATRGNFSIVLSNGAEQLVIMLKAANKKDANQRAFNIFCPEYSIKKICRGRLKQNTSGRDELVRHHNAMVNRPPISCGRF